MYKDFNKYEVYEDGRIWSYSRKKFLKPITEKNGYQSVWLVDNEGQKKKYLVHRVVWEAVTGEPIPKGMQCNHISEDKTDNRFCNINLLTPKQNINFGTRTERMIKTKSKQVGAFQNGELVMAFSSTMEAGRLGFHQGNVAACCRGERKTHKGYTWKYI